MCLVAVVSAVNCFDAHLTNAKDLSKQASRQPLRLDDRPLTKYDSYILGPGDGLHIELLDLPELSGVFSIGPDGTIFLPRLRALYVEGLTIEELRQLLTEEYKFYVIDPQIYVRPVTYRPIRIYVGGEVRRPGYYTLGGVNQLGNFVSIPGSNNLNNADSDIFSSNREDVIGQRFKTTTNFGKRFIFPTVFDAIRTAQGITPYSDLSNVQVTRKRAEGLGGGRVRTNLDFLSLITQGSNSQNIRLFVGDVVSVGKSNIVMLDQLLKAGRTNLNPEFINVFVNGRVRAPGGVTVPNGSSLNQAIAVAGGTRLLKGRVEFVRITREGDIDRRFFSYNSTAPADAPNNPVLSAGDLIRVHDSPLSALSGVVNEVTMPAIGIYSAYSLFK